MDTTTAGRVLIGDSLGFHIIIVALSIGLPVLLSIFEWYAWRKNSDIIRGFVRLLARWTGVFVIGGVMSGTIIALQFSTLWAPFMNEARPVVGKFFQLEGYMFLVEAAFLSWYFATMKHVGTKRHFLISLPISVGTIGSAFFITAVNAWMNNPTATITSTTFNEFFHSVVSYLFATTLVVLGYVAWRSLRGAPTKPKKQFMQWAMGRLSIIAGILLLTLALLGHASAVDIAHTQPHKLAAIELLDTTQTNAPFRLGGHINSEGKAEGGIVIPGLLSLLVGNSVDTRVQGLDQYPRERWPLLIVHTLFDIKMALVGYSVLLISLAVYFYWKHREQPIWLRKTLVMSGLVGLVMVELGWMITELGRQPWAVVGKQLTADAFTKDANIMQTGIIFPILFVILTIASLYALSYTSRHWRATEKLSW
ncbi:MAG: cytochrome ubiquinol oxidase subunit I [Candidatus Saccharimonas sp.]